MRIPAKTIIVELFNIYKATWDILPTTEIILAYNLSIFKDLIYFCHILSMSKQILSICLNATEFFSTLALKWSFINFDMILESFHLIMFLYISSKMWGVFWGLTGSYF